MLDALRPYSEMRETGLAWMPRVPAHWQIWRSKYLFREADERSVAGEETHLSMSQRLGLVPSHQTSRTLISESYAGGRLVEPNDLVLNRLKAHLGVFARAKQAGVISPDYTVLRPIGDFDVRYYEYLYRSEVLRPELRRRARGIVEGFWRLYTDDFGTIGAPVPSPEEQLSIVRFLDWHGSLTATLIQAKRRLITLLNEQKQAVIDQAFSCGKALGGVAPVNIDERPGWTVYPLKRVANINSKSLGKETPGDFEFDYLDIGCVGTGLLLNDPLRLRFEQAPSRARRCVTQGDTVISTVRTYLKAIYHIADPWPNLIASTGFAVLSPKIDRVSPAYLSMAIRSGQFINQIVSRSEGVAYPAISDTKLGALHLALPPLSEQKKIYDAASSELARFDLPISTTQKEIRLLLELRTKVIADVVTGQLDVRSVAGALPTIEAIEWVDAADSGDPSLDTVDDMEDAA